jgi:hypothetical protein
MNAKDAVRFVMRHGVVLEAAAGPVPSLAAVIAGSPIRGSWWGHARGREIFAASRAVRASPDVLVCRLVDGKVAYVARRLWPALVRLADRFPPGHLARVRESHTAAGRHVAAAEPFPEWVGAELAAEARGLDERAAARALGDWCAMP